MKCSAPKMWYFRSAISFLFTFSISYVILILNCVSETQRFDVCRLVIYFRRSYVLCTYSTLCACFQMIFIFKCVHTLNYT